MRDYGKVSPQFWVGQTGKSIRSEGAECQVVALYLMSSPHANMIGLYYLPVVFLSHETGIPIEGASKALRSLCEIGFCSYDHDAEVVWVHEMARYQVGDSLKPADKRVLGIQNEIKKVPKNKCLNDWLARYSNAFSLGIEKPLRSPFEAPSKPGAGTGAGTGAGIEEPSQDQAKSKSATAMPTGFDLTESMLAYAKDKAPGIDPGHQFEKFKNYHAAKGSKFKDWSAAWRTWILNTAKWEKAEEKTRPRKSLAEAMGEN